MSDIKDQRARASFKRYISHREKSIIKEMENTNFYTDKLIRFVFRVYFEEGVTQGAV